MLARLAVSIALIAVGPIAVVLLGSVKASERKNSHQGAMQAGTLPTAPSEVPERAFAAAAYPARPDQALLGVILPRESANVTAPLPGKVLTVNVRVGDRVRANDVLATLDQRLVAADLMAAEASADSQAAELEMARAAQQTAEAHRDRAMQLGSEGLLSGEAVSDRDSESRQATLRVDSARAALAQVAARTERLKREGQLMVVRAPFAGTVVARYVDPGGSISDTTRMPIVRLISSDRLFLRFSVPAARVGELGPGALIRATTDPPGATLLGSVERVASEVNTSTLTTFAEASIDEAAGEVLAGLVVRVTPRAEATLDVSYGRSAP